MRPGNTVAADVGAPPGDDLVWDQALSLGGGNRANEHVVGDFGLWDFCGNQWCSVVLRRDKCNGRPAAGL